MINLLPLQKKNELKIEKQLRIIILFGSRIIIALIILASLIFSFNIYLRTQLEAGKILIQTEEKAIEFLEIKDIKKEITEMNYLFSKVNAFYEKQLNLTKVLEQISFLRPSGIHLLDFSYRKADSQIILNGRARDRRSFLEFKKFLEKQENFINLYSPISNLIMPEDINFYLRFTIVP